MIKNKFLVPPERLDMPVLQYDFSQVSLTSSGIFNEQELNLSLKSSNALPLKLLSKLLNMQHHYKAV